MNTYDTVKNPNRIRRSAREKILRRFEKWLDEVLENEAPLEGLDLDLFSELDRKDSPSDLDAQKKDYFSTWSALTALTQEVRLQGRAFRDLSGKVEPLSGMEAVVEGIHAEIRNSLKESRNLTGHAEDLFEDRKKMRQKAMNRAKGEFLETFLEMRERLYTGLMSAGEAWQKMCEKRSPGWFGGDLRIQKLRTEAAEVISSLRKGYELSIERLDEMLMQHDVHEISCRGARFDPETMNAVDVEQRDDMPDGTVLEVYRRGYTMENELYRPAQVKVSKMPKGAHWKNRRHDIEFT